MKNILILVIVFLFAVSCRKFLDKKPMLSLAEPTSLKELQALLDNNDLMNRNSAILAQVVTDEYYLIDSDWKRLNEANKNAYLWGKDIYEGPNLNDWGYVYRPVYYSNEVLEKLRKIKREEANKNEYDYIFGSALFYRSYNFLQALSIWAKAYNKETADTDLGIPIRLSANFDERSFRASVKDCYEQVIKDLKKSVELLHPRTVHPMRPSRQAAIAALARTYLYMAQFDSCMKYTNEALAISDKLIDFNTINPALRFPFLRFNDEVLFHSRCFFTYQSPRNTYARVDTLLYNSYEKNDLRKTLFFNNNTDGSRQFRGSFDNSIYLFNGIPMAELYMMKAECLARKNDPAQAITVLDKILVKRWKNGSYVSTAGTAPENVLQRILEERKKELIFMNLRWMDIKRLNELKHNIILKRVVEGKEYILPPNDNRYALPLPNDIIELTGMPQNPQ